jgi:hypothetical protein
LRGTQRRAVLKKIPTNLLTISTMAIKLRNCSAKVSQVVPERRSPKKRQEQVTSLASEFFWDGETALVFF